VFLLLGAVVNVAVAWSAAVLTTPPPAPAQVCDQPGTSFREVIVRRGRMATMVVTNQVRTRWEEPGVIACDGIVPDWSLANVDRRADVGRSWPCDNWVMLVERAWGWPYPSLRMWSCEMRGYIWVRHHHSALVLSGNFRDYLFPLRPIWPGLVLDSTMYAGLGWACVASVMAGRRRWRRGRGRCPTCGYDLRGEVEQGCSECGWNRPGETTA